MTQGPPRGCNDIRLRCSWAFSRGSRGAVAGLGRVAATGDPRCGWRGGGDVRGSWHGDQRDQDDGLAAVRAALNRVDLVRVVVPRGVVLRVGVLRVGVLRLVVVADLVRLVVVRGRERGHGAQGAAAPPGGGSA